MQTFRGGTSPFIFPQVQAGRVGGILLMDKIIRERSHTQPFLICLKITWGFVTELGVRVPAHTFPPHAAGLLWRGLSWEQIPHHGPHGRPRGQPDRPLDTSSGWQGGPGLRAASLRSPISGRPLSGPGKRSERSGSLSALSSGILWALDAASQLVLLPP